MSKRKVLEIKYIHICVYVFICVCTHSYVERERDTHMRTYNCNYMSYGYSTRESKTHRIRAYNTLGILFSSKPHGQQYCHALCFRCRMTFTVPLARFQ